MHLIERHDNLVIAHLVHDAIDLLMITTLCLSFTLKETDDVSWREYTNLLGVSILSFLLLFGLSSFQMQQHSAIDTGRDTLHIEFGDCQV